MFTPTYCFCTFFNADADVSNNNSKSLSAAVSANSVLFVMIPVDAILSTSLAIPKNIT